MNKTQSSENILLYLLLAYSPVLFGFLLMLMGAGLNIVILLTDLNTQFLNYLLYMLVLFVAPALLIILTYLFWQKVSNWLWRGASLYLGLTLMAGLVLFVIMIGIAGASMAVADAGVVDVSGVAVRESMKWLAYSQVCVIPWVFGVITLLIRKFSK